MISVFGSKSVARFWMELHVGAAGRHAIFGAMLGWKVLDRVRNIMGKEIFIPTVGSMMLGTVNRLNTERRRIA